MTPTPEHAAMTRERNESGRYVETVAPDDVLGTFDTVDGPVITSTDVSEYLECTTEAARQKLKRLVNDGALARRRTGRTFVYWRTDETAAQTGETAPSAETGATHAPDTAATDDALADAVDRVAAEWEDTDDRLAARKAAARAVLDYAREHGSVSKQEAKEEVYPEYPVADQNPRTWYRKNIRPVLNDAAEYDQSARAYRLTDV